MSVLGPALATLFLMAIVWSLVGAILIVEEGIIVGWIVTELFALVCMFVVPHLVVGLVWGYRSGFDASAAISAGLAPVILAFLSLAAFRGPVLAPLQAFSYTIVAIIVWTLTFGAGMALAARLRSNS